MLIIYSANNSAPITMIAPNTTPINVGQEVPASGSDGSVGDASANAVSVAVGLGVAVAVAGLQEQSLSVKHCGFLQLPLVAPLAM